MATLDSYPDMIMGHVDTGRGDGIWRWIASFYLFGKKHERFREVMDNITWWYDLSRTTMEPWVLPVARNSTTPDRVPRLR